MNYQKHCGECGHIEAAYTKSLNVPMVQAIRKLVDIYEREKKPTALGEIGLDHSQYGNFSILKFFELAESVEGGWIPTPLGIDFVYGRAKLTLPIAIMYETSLPPDHEAWATHDAPRHTVFVQDIDQFSYKKRPEYAAEKTPGLFS